MPSNIRLLTQDDLPFAQEVRTIAGWNQTDRDWLRLMEAAPDGCFLIECDSTPAGTATTTSYGSDLAWIGMVLVHPDFRRRGLATALLEHCLHHLLEVKGIACVKLDATPDGQKVYEKLGFQAEYELSRWESRPQELSSTLEARSAFDPSATADMDTIAFGTDRSDFLRRLFEDSIRTIQWERGYAMIRPGVNASYLGPLVTDSTEAGNKAIRELVSAVDQERIYWDIPDDNLDAISTAEELGFVRQRPLIRMWTGQPLSDRREWQWAIGAPETG